jgi:type II pantothenate kinase
MYAAIDFGTTNTDVVIHSAGSELNFYTFQTQNVNLEFIDKIFKEISIDLSKIKSIAVTGGKSSNLENSYKEIPIEKINEIDAIALGAKNLYEINEDSFVVISAGTGTACVHSNGVTHNHLGGISVGGGTLQGLSNCILGTSTQSNIDKLSAKGKRENVDLLIGDVVNEIGSLYPEITASNFARARNIKNISNEDIAASLSNMVGEVIGTVSYLNALLMGVQKVYFIGRVSNSDTVKKGIEDRLQLASVEGCFSNNREFGNALGALRFIKAK